MLKQTRAKQRGRLKQQRWISSASVGGLCRYSTTMQEIRNLILFFFATGSTAVPVAAAPEIVAPPKGFHERNFGTGSGGLRCPPPPTANDPYPGYYQLPSGSWAAHDPDYYMSFFRNLAKEAEGPIGRGWDGVDKMDKEGMQDINAFKGLEEERRLAEERKKLTAPDLYSEESSFKVRLRSGWSPGQRVILQPVYCCSAIGKTTGKAGQRHQLTALLKDAHANRSALEERIAANKRTKRESGAKYGELRVDCTAPVLVIWDQLIDDDTIARF